MAKRAAARTLPGDAARAPAARPVAGYTLEAQVGHLLRRAHQRHTAIFQEGMGDIDLTPTQFAALAKLREADDISQNELGRMTAMDPATIQGVIQRLLARDLIERRADPNDRRLMLLRLSAKGRTVINAAVARAVEITEATLAPLTKAERPILLALLRKLS